MKPPARAIVGNLVFSTDGGVWAVWDAQPFAHAHTAVGDKLAVHSRIRGLLLSLPSDSMLLSICERLDPLDVVTRMAEGVDLETQEAWGVVCEATAEWLSQVSLHNRRYYVCAQLPAAQRGWKDVVRDTFAGVSGALGATTTPVADQELEQRRRQARELEIRLAQHVRLHPVSPGEISWLYARALRREADEPPFDALWEPSLGEAGGRDNQDPNDPSRWRPRAVLSQLTDAVVKEGGFGSDPDRPKHRRYVRIDSAGGTGYQTVLAMADMPHYFAFPGGGGEWLYHADRVGFPVDWCVRIKAVPNADAQSKVRRKHRDLIGQVDEYDGELTGAPPQLAEAIQAIDDQRTQLGSNPSEPELQVTIMMSVAADNLADLEDRAGALTALFEPQEYGLARPTGGQVALLRSMLPGTTAAQVCRDYTQFMLTRDMAAGSPFCGPEVGDPQGLLLGISLDGGNGTPVLFDPAYGPKANASPSLAAVGRLGSGKSFFLKRLCWDAVARGGQVVTIDRTASGEYVRFAQAVAGRVQVVRLEAGAEVHLDPMRSFQGDERTSITLGFMSLLAGCSTHSEEGAALAEAVDTVAEHPNAGASDVIDELERMGSDPREPDPAARGLARRLSHYRKSPTGQIAFGRGQPMSLDADFIVFWAPNLALPDRDTLSNEHSMRMMLPEQVLGQALLYLVAAVGRRVVFSDPSRFAAALYDEAWALLASPHGQKLLVEGVRDGRKHNGAIWLASQHPNDFAISELEDLLGSRFVFRQARQAIPSALRFLGVADSVDAAATLEGGLGTGQCLYRDVRDRVGLIHILPPVLPEVEASLETAPTSAHRKDVEGSEVAEIESVDMPALDPAAVELFGEDGIPLALPEADDDEIDIEPVAPGSYRGPVRDDPRALGPEDYAVVDEGDGELYDEDAYGDDAYLEDEDGYDDQDGEDWDEDPAAYEPEPEPEPEPVARRRRRRGPVEPEPAPAPAPARAPAPAPAPAPASPPRRGRRMPVEYELDPEPQPARRRRPAAAVEPGYEPDPEYVPDPEPVRPRRRPAAPAPPAPGPVRPHRRPAAAVEPGYEPEPVRPRRRPAAAVEPEPVYEPEPEYEPEPDPVPRRRARPAAAAPVPEPAVSPRRSTRPVAPEPEPERDPEPEYVPVGAAADEDEAALVAGERRAAASSATPRSEAVASGGYGTAAKPEPEPAAAPAAVPAASAGPTNGTGDGDGDGQADDRQGADGAREAAAAARARARRRRRTPLAQALAQTEEP
jgi:AAA domain-containing protein